MKKTIFLSLLLTCSMAKAQRIPFVYEQENTGANVEVALPDVSELPVVESLTDPLMWSNGKGRVKSFAEWSKRRGEIAKEIQHYGIGVKPAVELKDVKARMEGERLIVDVERNGKSITLKMELHYPKTGSAPYPLMIGTSNNSLPSWIFLERPIAYATYRESQVNPYSQFGGEKGGRGTYPFDSLYPEYKDNGAYAEWAWGISRLLDGLQILGPEKTKIDMKHIGVTGCSYAGKMALYCGAFDERIALTIAQEPGGGGAAAWRVSSTMEEVESIDRTDYHWFQESQKTNFGGENVKKLPYDQHELCALVCPRALLLLGNPDYKWLADEAMYVSANAAKKVWQAFGIGDRMGYSIQAGHPHCMLPAVQCPEVEGFVDRFLLGKEYMRGNVGIAPMFEGKVDLERWIKW